jgi:NAD+ kinase
MFQKIGVVFKETLDFESQVAPNLEIVHEFCSEILIFGEELKIPKNKWDFSHNVDAFIQQVDLVLVFGGDGTILKAAKDFIIGNKPILGINMGNVGFLTDVSLDNLSKLLQEIFSGDFVIEERSLVQATIGDFKIFGLNEIVIHSGSYAQLMQYSLELDEKTVYELRADGLIISTSTGSTAYSLSAGGSIISPKLDVWSIIPILSHNLSSRPFVISSEQTLTVNLINGPKNEASISADGQKDINVPFGKSITINKKKDKLKLIHPKSYNFFEACREKLGWSIGTDKNNK